MATLRDINRRIASVGNIQQITKAMQLVAATKMRRAQQRVLASRPYSEKLVAVLQELASRRSDHPHPFLRRGPTEGSGSTAARSGRQALVLITADRGLAGSLNTNVIRLAARWIRDQPQRPAVLAVGRRGRDFLRRSGQDIVAEATLLGDRPTLDDLRPLVQVAMEEYLAGEVESVQLIFTRFGSTVRQVPTLMQLLPVALSPRGGEATSSGAHALYLWEPSPEAVLDALLPRYVEAVAYQALLENLASEHAARMVAMQNATDNAQQLIGDLTLTRNKVRQATITLELMDIVSGAEALSAR